MTYPAPNVTLDVKDFGAVGDGVTDDADAIQSALDAAKGGDVVFGAGRIYRVSRPVVVTRPGHTIRGFHFVGPRP